jgi:S-adenosyl-L-methionine methyltransferase
MSRLDSFIRRLTAQRACLDHAVHLVADLPGPVLEVGLGNGRTYDHLRERLPNREIFVFDRQVAAHPDCIPPADYLLLGDFRETLTAVRQRLGNGAALVHADIGSGDEAANARLAAELAPLLVALLMRRGILLSDQAIAADGLTELPPPADVKPGRYFLYRAAAA